jgi:hypothetical protein
MTDTQHADWLYQKYGRHPDSILTIIRLGDKSPFLTDAPGEQAYRDRMIRLVASMVAITDDNSVDDLQEEFRLRFTARDANAVKGFVVYLTYLTLKDFDWPEEVTFDAVVGEPVIRDVEAMWRRSENPVMGLLALHLNRGRGGQ